MPTALITPENLLHEDGPYVANLKDAGFEVAFPREKTFTRGLCGEQETIEQLSICDALIAGGEHLTESVLAALPRLRVIARSGVGYDRVDVAAATARKIAVTITPTANHESVAEHAMMLLLGVAKSIVVNDQHSRAGRWPMPTTQPVRGRTCGIFGLGRIGRSFAVRAKAMGMRVIATEMYPDEDFVAQHGIELVDFDALLSSSDYLSIHCPVTEETTRLFKKDVFAKMKPGSVFINTARGALVVEADLYDALQSGHLLGAGTDVYEQEPPSADNPLFQLDNIICTPHCASADWRSQEDMGIEAADCIIKLHRGLWPKGAVVNPVLESDWSW
jgi:phosphoglycerate dehydrogenase-like enzyme